MFQFYSFFFFLKSLDDTEFLKINYNVQVQCCIRKLYQPISPHYSEMTFYLKSPLPVQISWCHIGILSDLTKEFLALSTLSKAARPPSELEVCLEASSLVHSHVEKPRRQDLCNNELKVGLEEFSPCRRWVRVGHSLASELGKGLIVTPISRKVRVLKDLCSFH